ncbi:phospholipase [Coprinopsis marcescibilis]|uniref:Phospholipase n=1 Tax=Coprinopsis marcescibilis TaxID=230819 RepID=A0A5C3KX30_COPMA|nr:phospholipase [Coprinopsis marcescibilis]
MSKSSGKILAQSSAPCLVEANSDDTVSHLWFKTEPIDRKFCYRAVQVQLETLSGDQGLDTSELNKSLSYSWFELAIYKDAKATEPSKKNDKPLVWRSHGNRTDPLDDRKADTLHFGKIFDRRHDLFDYIEVGNVIGVHVCAKYSGWLNDAQNGRLLCKFVNYDLFSPSSWSIGDSVETSSENAGKVEDGVYTLTPTTECDLTSESNEQTDKIWFTTPALDAETISKLQDIQLFTVVRHVGQPQEGTGDNIWSWFDLVILENPDSTTPVKNNEQALVWRSHNVPVGHQGKEELFGRLFTSKVDDIFSNLKPGNAIGVRPSTRFVGWELHASSARLVVRVSKEVTRKPLPKPKVKWGKIIASNADLEKLLKDYLGKATPQGEPGAQSVETSLLNQELRADRTYGQNDPPLRLLSLDGGGVRGISSLYVLKDIMRQVAGDENAKPCDYFDMMAGTSTGGLIAIMLGRLRMTIDQCIAAYTDLAKKIFSAGVLEKVDNAADTGARYSGEVLAAAIKSVVGQYTQNPDAPMRDDKNDCKVFVTTCRADNLNNSIATHMRTYTNKSVDKSFADFKIWEAARATSAAPTYFPRIKLGDFEYIDGGVGFNNPVLLLLLESRLQFGFARPLGCLVTIGTGMNPNIALPETGSNVLTNAASAVGTVFALVNLITSSEHANQIAQGFVDSEQYFRFNLGKKILERRWVEKVSPGFFGSIFGEKDKYVEHYTPENWLKIAKALDDYGQMDDLVRMTKVYMDTEPEKGQATKVASKLPPKTSQRLPSTVKA